MTESFAGVVIVGAGPVGLVTALTLAQAGVACLVLEAEPGIVQSPRALVYQPSTVAAMDALGLLPDLRAIGILKQDTEWRTRDGTVLGRQDLATLAPGDTEYPFHLHLGQAKLAGVALDHFARLPGGAVRWNHRVAALAPDDAGVTLEVDTGNGRISLRAPWVIGADGASSTVRRALGIDFPGLTWPEWFVATDVRCDFGAHGYPKATFIVDPVDWAVIVQIDDHGLYRVTYGEPPEIPREALHGRVLAKYAALLPDGRQVEPEAFSPYRVHDRCAATFRAGRVLLAGDAAHANNPIGGLGLTTGLLDGHALGQALARVIRGDAPETILDRYAEERRGIFQELVSPAARENKRRLSEADPARRRADAERLQAMTEDPEFARRMVLFTNRLVSRPQEW